MRDRMLALRLKRKLLQKEVAEAVGITTSYYGMIEQGVRTPNLGLAKKIAEFYDTTVEIIFFSPQNNKTLKEEKMA